MPTGARDDPDGLDIPTFSVDDLTFATPDLAREPAPDPLAAPDMDFTVAKRPAEDHPARLEKPAATAPRPALPGHAFVIREPGAVAPATPVDALVVGATAPVADPSAAQLARSLAFRISGTAGWAVPDTSDELPWIVRNPKPAPFDEAAPPRAGWAPRVSNVNARRTADAMMLRLREEAVHVSWKSAWIAVNAADPRLAGR